MHRQMPTTLAHLLAGAGHASISGNPDVNIASIAVDSRTVEPGALFVCLRGEHEDGHDYAAAAVAAGAAAILAQRQIPVPQGTSIAVVDDTLAVLSAAAASFYGHPSEALTVVGVTGTNGKTTTTHFIDAIAHSAGIPFGLIGTLGARLRGAYDEALEHTTPLSHDVQRLIARFRDAGAAGAVLEVSSHALSLHRVDNVAFDVAVFTNLTHDHLDFHASFDDYRAAKRSLFEMTARNRGKGPGVGVLNADDPESAALASILSRCFTFGIENAAALFNATDVSYGVQGSTFSVRTLRPAPFTIRLPGPFNVSNAMAALAAAAALDFEVESIAEGLVALEAVPGRMTTVAAGDIAVYVDYAHTPDGLRKVLEAARALAKGRLICVFGCGGDRDSLKRPVMGRIASESSDLTIVTTDNPRFEDPDKIIEEIVAGMGDAPHGAHEVEPNRAAAIERAIASARPGDVVVIAGKGHEAYQLVRGERISFSDVLVARAAISKARAC